MTRLPACLALLCLTAFAVAAERIPADCRWVIHADAQALLKSKVGERIAKELTKPQAAAQLRVLEAVTGLDPRRDLKSATICGVGADDDTGLVYVRGAFDAARITTIAQAAEGHVEVQVGSRTIHTWLDKGKPAAGCLAAADLVLFAKTPERIRQALTLLDAPAYNGAVLALPQGWDKSALVVCAADQIEALAAGKPESAMLRNVKSFAARLTEQGADLVLEARATAATETAAQQMVDAGRGLAAIVQLQRPENLDPVLIEAVRTAQLAREATVVSLRIALPMDDIMRLIEQAKGR